MCTFTKKRNKKVKKKKEYKSSENTNSISIKSNEEDINFNNIQKFNRIENQTQIVLISWPIREVKDITSGKHFNKKY